MIPSTRDARLYSRRAVIAAAGAAAMLSTAKAAATPALEAVAFDAFTVFDPRPIATMARARFGERGDLLANVWSTKLFGYTWLSDAAGQYSDFESLADAALRFAAKSLDLQLPDRDRRALVGCYGQLGVWPDVKPALQRLRAANLRLVLLSNLGEATLRENMRRNALDADFEFALSTDRVRRFKPAPAAYRMAMDALGLPKRSIGFAAFAGWDAAGATWFGYRTAWINRLGAPDEPLAARPAIVARTMEGVLELAGFA